MIWNGKRYKGVQAYVGRLDGEEPGNYIVVYWCNGVTRKYGERHVDAAVGMTLLDTTPTTVSSVDTVYLRRNFREVSQRKIPERLHHKLARYIEDRE